MSGSLYLSLNPFWPASRCTVSSGTTIFSQSKVQLHLWWNKKIDSIRFSLTVTETCYPLLGFQLAFIMPGFLMTLQISSTFLSVRALSLWGLSSPCSLMSNLAALGLNLSCSYISCSHKSIISGPCAWCTCWIYSAPLQFIDPWCIVSWRGSSIFAYSASELISLSSWCTGFISESDHSGS